MESWLIAVLAGLAALFLAMAIGWWLLRRIAWPSRELVQRIGALSWRERLALAAGLVRDPRIPLVVRLLIPALGLYLLLPLDIIPDFIPIVGALDDILLLLLVLHVVLRSVPKGVLDDHLERIEYERRELAGPSLTPDP